ncbi:MAG TPA: KUP/HAK/KT family potassium transporter [Kofleriaceae bacterium]|nr:KUP/HAK/KT family potassium transporter [Kofleriaceae bacterium]
MTHPEPGRAKFALLCLGALGVVFGDIGTSPLYTLKQCMHEAGDAAQATLFGVLSLIAWSLVLVVTVKYLLFIMRADNRGEGGIFALLALVPSRLRANRLSVVAVLVVVGAALLYGDGAITPAISVLSAVEGLEVAKPDLARFVIPLTCAILFGLFWIQKHGTHTIGRLFGPVMVVWFATIGIAGAWHVVDHPAVLQALSPVWGVRYFIDHGPTGLLILGAVVLAVTGGEALYADMGHFGRTPIRTVWLAFVLPSLVLCYFGQGALLVADPTIRNPFFALVPAGAPQLALVILSSVATVIASQALISGAFSLTRQAMQLGYFPRVTIRHTSNETEGQIYIPEINWFLAIVCIALVVAFQKSERLAAAYGIAVTGTMAITSVVYYVVTRQTWGWSRARALPLLALFLAFDVPFFAANLFKFADGGYVPILIAAGFVLVMLIWARGRQLTVDTYATTFPSFDELLPALDGMLVGRVPGTAVYLASREDHMPPALMHLVARSHTLHEHVILLTVKASDTEPRIAPADRVEFTELGKGFMRVVIHTGFSEQPKVHDVLEQIAAEHGLPFGSDDVTYFLARLNLLGGEGGKMGKVTETIYSFLQRNSVSADRYFGLPPAQVVEIGTQIDL